MKNPPISAERQDADRRREPRVAGSGAVRLHREETLAQPIEGILLDYSPHGFRASHGIPTLGQGEFVRFEHAWGAGRARVIWTRILGAQVESGFLVLS